MSRSYLTPINMNGNALIAPAYEALASDPSSPKLGQFWLNTTSLTPKFYSGSAVVPMATQAYVQSAVGAAGGGDMLKSVYDTTNNGVVDAAETVPWSGTSVGRPSTFPPSTHTHLAADITNFAAQVALVKVNAAVAADTVPWSGTSSGRPTTFPPSAHNHVAADITDLLTFVNSAVGSYIDVAAGANDAFDTVQEIIAQIMTNQTDIAARAKRFAQSIGDGTATSFTVTHNLNTRDIVVSVYDNASYAEVFTDVAYTTANTITLAFAVAPTANQYRVAVIG